jgi:NAD(P)-dependent dehydrogenase (short-subunit alcohol dehydrogenase family)
MSYQPLDVDLSGRAALVTGATSGMGKETARELARMGADVILGCRDTQRGEVVRLAAARGPMPTRRSSRSVSGQLGDDGSEGISGVRADDDV